MSQAMGLKVELTGSAAEARERVTAALKTQGFGVLTEINVRATLKEKLGEDVAPYWILGACNPPLAHRALTLAPEMGLLLPCNVTVREIGPGRVEVALVDPLAMMSAVENPALEAVAVEARQRLERVRQALQE